MLDQRHELYRLAGKIDWSVVEERFDPLYSEEGRPAIAIRLMGVMCQRFSGHKVKQI